MTTGADLAPKALVGSMSFTPLTLIVAVEMAGASGALAAVFLAAGFWGAVAAVCARRAEGVARSNGPKAARVKSAAGKVGGRRGTGFPRKEGGDRSEGN